MKPNPRRGKSPILRGGLAACGMVFQTQTARTIETIVRRLAAKTIGTIVRRLAAKTIGTIVRRLAARTIETIDRRLTARTIGTIVRRLAPKEPKEQIPSEPAFLSRTIASSKLGR